MNWFAYLGICLLMTFSPGPAVVLALSNTLQAGSRAAWCSSAGNALGILCVAALSLGSVHYLLQLSPDLSRLLHYLGALYLVYLSWRMLRHVPLTLTNTLKKTQADLFKSFRQGYWVALSNPKSLLFFTSLFPNFLQGGETSLYQQFLMIAVFASSALLSHSLYILAASWICRHFQTRRMPVYWRLIPAACLAGFALSFIY